MKRCDHCDKDYDEEQACSVCGEKLRDITLEEAEAAEIVLTMTLTGIL